MTFKIKFLYWQCNQYLNSFFTMWKITRRAILQAMYGELFEEQWWVCAICGTNPMYNKKLSIDHNHETWEVRGLLCTKCNMLLWRARDDVNILQWAIEYLSQEPYWTDYDRVCWKWSEFFWCSTKEINSIFWRWED